MSWKVADLYVSITGDSRPLNNALAGVHNQLLGLLGPAGSIGQRISNGILAPLLGAAGGAEMLAASLGVGLAGATAVGLSKAVLLASHLQESTNKAEQAFGSYKKTVMAGADEMAAKFGIVKKTYLDAASGFGLKLQGVGIGAEQSAQMANTLTKLAADTSSMYEMTMEEAVTRMFSGLNGEMEAVSRWGVNLTEQNIQLKAVTMGLSNGKKELDQYTKTMVRYKLLLEGLAPAQGDLDRTSRDFANSLKHAQGNLENFATAVGERILPAATDTVNAFNDVAPAIWNFVSFMLQGPMAFFQGLIDGFRNLIGVVTWVGRKLGIFGEEQAAAAETDIDARIADRQKALTADQAAGAAMGGGKGKEHHAWHGSLVEYYNKIAESAVGKRDKNGQLLDAANKQVDLQAKMLAALQQKGGNGAAIAIAG